MQAINVPSIKHETPQTPILVEVWVDHPTRHPLVEPGWYYGELNEWALREEIGWTASVRYRVPSDHSQSSIYSANFLSEHVRPYPESER